MAPWGNGLNSEFELENLIDTPWCIMCNMGSAIQPSVHG